jgi:hypothetical protein
MSNDWFAMRFLKHHSFRGWGVQVTMGCTDEECEWNQWPRIINCGYMGDYRKGDTNFRITLLSWCSVIVAENHKGI